MDNFEPTQQKYVGDWYGSLEEWMPYYHIKTENDPKFWPDAAWRIKAKCDHRDNGGFDFQYALENNYIRIATSDDL